MKSTASIFRCLSCSLLLSLGSLVSAATLLDTSTPLALTDPTQMGRLNRDGKLQDWSTGKVYPGIANPATSYHYRTFTIPASTIGAARFVQVITDSVSTLNSVSAYSPAYLPGSAGAPNLGLDVNWLGDAGTSGNYFNIDPIFFQVVVPTGQDLVIVLNDVTGGASIGGPLHVIVEGFTDNQFTEPPASIVPTEGTPQTANSGKAFSTTLKAKVTDAQSAAVVGATVTFTAPASGAGGTFAGGANTSNVITDANGLATASVFTANSIAGTYIVAATVPGVAAPANFTLTNLPALKLESGPTETPAPVTVNQPATFTASASGGAGMSVYTWDFGDGTSGSGASTTHVYALPGSYNAKVSVTDGSTTVTGTVQVTVIAAIPVVGTGPDSDGDGFSDSFETALQTNPSDVANTPTGHTVTTANVQALTLLKPSIKLNFSKAGKDSITFSGTVAVPAGFVVKGAVVEFDVGGILKVLTLNEKGTVKNGGDTAKVSIKSKKGMVSAQTAKYAAAFKNGSFSTASAGAGLTNADVKSAPVTVAFTFIFNGTVFQKVQAMTYKAKKGKMGTASVSAH